MSQELKDLAEFNQRITSYRGNDLPVDCSEPSPPIRGHNEVVRENTETEKTGVNNNQMWAVYGKDRFSPCEYSEKTLPPGQYNIEYSDTIGLHFHAVDVNVDELLHLPDSAAETVIDEVKVFWEREQHFRNFGFLWKRGILLWGPAGSGKTSCVQQISQFVVQHHGIVIYLTNPNAVAKGLRLLRDIEPSRPVVILIEDIDTIIQEYGESSLLALLDGELQVDNILFIATTNYPERLDKRIINRPSRFDLVKKIGMPSKEAREMYIRTKCERLVHPDSRAELDSWVNKTSGFSIAHIKELIVSVEVFEVPFDHAVARLSKMMDVHVSSDQAEDRVFGFTTDERKIK